MTARTFSLLLSLSLLGSAAQGAIFTWDGGNGTSVNWNTATNWAGDTAPPNSYSTDLIFSGTYNTGTSGTPLNQNIANPLQINSITFGATAGHFYLGGNAFEGNSAISVTQNSNSAQDIANNIAFGSNVGTLTLAGDGTGVVTLGGVLSSKSSGGKTLHFVKNGSSIFVLKGNNTPGDGTTTINDGTLVAGHANAFGSGTLTVNNGGTLAVAGGITLTKAATFSSGGILGGLGTYRPGSSFTVASGVHVAPGIADGTNNVGTLSLGASGNAMNVTFSSGSVLDFDFGAPGASQGTPGSSDRIAASSTLTFPSSGSVTLNLSDAGSMGNGWYKLFTYGSLVNFNAASSIAIGTSPLGNKRYLLSSTNSEIDLQIKDAIAPAILGLNVSAGSSRIFTGQSTTITGNILNSGTFDVHDSMNWSAGGYLSGNGSALAPGSSSTLTRSFTGTATGLITLSVTATGTNSTIGGNATNSPLIRSTSVDVVGARTLSAGSETDFGRFLIGSKTATTGVTATTGDHALYSDVTLGSASVSGFASVAGSGTMNGNNGSGTLTLIRTFATGGLTGGSFNLTEGNGLTAEFAGGASALAVSWTANPVDNRTLAAMSVDLGKILVGKDSINHSSTISSTAAHSLAANVTLNSGAYTANVTDGTILLTTSANYLFNGSNVSTSGGVAGHFTTSGSRSGTAMFAGNTAGMFTGEGLSGQVLQPMSVSYAADVYDAAAVSSNAGATLSDGQGAWIADGAGHRSSIMVASYSISSGWEIANVGSIAAGSTRTLTVDGPNKKGLLNGTVLTGQLTVTLQNDQAIAGSAPDELGTLAWNLQEIVTGNRNSGSTTIHGSHNFRTHPLGMSSSTSRATVAQIIAGIVPVGVTVTPTMTFDTPLHPYMRHGAAFTPASDTVDLAGVSKSDGVALYVLRMTYDPGEPVAAALIAAVGGEDKLALGWWDPSRNVWRLAVEGNSSGAPTPIQGAYQDAYFALGYYGVDTAAHEVWAVVDHTSQYAAIPEPGTLVLLMVGGLASLLRKRR